MKNIDLISGPWDDYELLDSGENKKLERFGKTILIRPETQAIWSPSNPELWAKADGEFIFEKERGRWIGQGIPESWEISWGKAKFILKPTSFKHIGIFPEQAVNWEWIREKVSKLENPKVLNLFGYTGIASIVSAQNGAEVTHLDSSKQSNFWAKENASLSGIEDEKIRYILDDAIKFAERENRRGSKYEGIILDPPAFGRGANNEIWRIEESLLKLLKIVQTLSSEKEGSFILLNGYAAGYSPTSFMQVASEVFGKEDMEYGELGIKESGSNRIVPSGIYIKIVK